MSKFIDLPGIPEFFMTEVRTEMAGGGCVRIFNCVERSGFLIPQCTVIIPAMNMIPIMQKVDDAARAVLNRWRLDHLAAH